MTGPAILLHQGMMKEVKKSHLTIQGMRTGHIIPLLQETTKAGKKDLLTPHHQGVMTQGEVLKDQAIRHHAMILPPEAEVNPHLQAGIQAAQEVVLPIAAQDLLAGVDQ